MEHILFGFWVHYGAKELCISTTTNCFLYSIDRVRYRMEEWKG